MEGLGARVRYKASLVVVEGCEVCDLVSTKIRQEEKAVVRLLGLPGSKSTRLFVLRAIMAMWNKV
jgi:hypothetical protein